MTDKIEWIDTIMFNGDLVVKLRLEYLYNYVSKFYICEQRYTHQGQRKDILYIEKYSEWFDKYRDKIVFVVDEECPDVDYLKINIWVCEIRHRNYTVPFILKNHEKFICTVCDCDEIPDREVIIKNFNNLYENSKTGVIKMTQDFFYYNFDWFVSKWSRPFIISDILLRESNEFQNYREDLGQINGYIDCGWHFSYFMDSDEIIRKLESVSETFEENNKNFNIIEIKNKDHIEKCIRDGCDLFMRNNQKFTLYDKSKLPQEFLLYDTNPSKDSKY
jgi:hypothetical protein